MMEPKKSDDCAHSHKDSFLSDFDAGADVLSNIELSPAVMKFLEQLNICYPVDRTM